MFLVKTKTDLQKCWLQTEKSVGFVPTMGALHEGHISLITKAKLENEQVVCSIFVNPTQFNNKLDFEKYPLSVENDIYMLEKAGTHVLFLPSVEEIYPHGIDHIKNYRIGYLDTVLDGAFRPGHFNGVCNVVQTLLDYVKPTNMYLGEKDFQQCLVIKQMVIDEHLDVNIITCETLREEDGLAMSSRNRRLNPEARIKARHIYRNLMHMKKEWRNCSFQTLQNTVFDNLTKEGFVTEYLLIANAFNLHLLTEFDPSLDMVALIASNLDGVRLIDNVRLNYATK